MSLTLTTDQTAQLNSLGISGRYADAYDLMKDWTAGATSYDLQLVHTWLLGAADINRGLGPFAALVKAYNQRQGLLRGHEVSDATNHEASDYIARLIIDEVVKTGAIPSFDYIRKADADSRLFLYGDRLSSGDTAATQAAAWTGNFLISPFGVDETGRLLSTGDPAAPDTLDDIKNVLFAYDAFESGLSGLTDTNPSFGSALHAAMAGWGLPETSRLLPLLTGLGPGWADKVIAGFVAGRLAANAFSRIGAVGQNKFLDMLMGTTQGTCLVNTTTDANFVTRAKDFFNAYGTTLQTIDAKFLPTDAASLTALAKTDVNVRAALVALSGVSVTVSATVADKLSLYDAATGQGFTDHWLQDRSAMLSWELKISKEGALATESKPYAPDMGLGLTAVPPLYFADVASGEKLYLGGQDRRYFVFGSENNDAIYGRGYSDHLYGGAGNDAINGSGGADYLEGGTGNDTLNGDGDNGEFFSLNGDPGNDKLEGGAGSDTYQFTEAWAKDMILDADGQGQIQIDGKAVGTAQGAGQRNTWIAKLGTGSGDYASLTVYDDATSSTGKKLVITKAKDSANTITVNNFNLDKATGSEGYLGINLDLTPNVAVVQGGGSNFWSDVEASLSRLAGKASTLTEGVGQTFTVYLNQAAKAGETVTLALSDLADKFQAVLGDSTVAANGAVITLAEGQTQVSFALIQEGEVTADGAGAISVSYQGEEQSAQSNSWALNLKDGGEITRTYNGDQRTKLIGIETLLDATPANSNYNTYTYPWTWETNGTLTDGVAQADFADVIYASTGNDKISGLGGNDALGGRAGNDQIDGGAGDDLIGGGSGSDSINGGDGNDYISSNAGLTAPMRSKPDENWSEFWSAPAGTTSQTQSATWGISVDTATKTVFWSGIGATLAVNPGDGDAIDGGAGNDYIIASWGDDRAQGGTGNDVLEGLAGADILEGGDGNDTIRGDGIHAPGYLSSVASASHGADFLDGGAGDDFIVGGGNNDQLFGGADNDVLIGDSATRTDNNYYVSLDYHGADYLDGEDGDDELVGGGKEDTLYGGAGNDKLWGDITANNIAQASDNALMWANDYLDGEDGNDYLEGGGKDDMLYGGLGDDKLFGDEQNIALKAEFQGQDYLDGEDGNDQLEGGAKDDTLYGGTGNDTLWGDSSSANLAGADHGNDYLDGEEGDDNMAGNGGDDTLYGGAGNDVVMGDSNAGDLAIEFQGNDYLDGEEGNDRLNGNGGDDTLYGSAGNDQLQGGDGNDQLNGGDDNDTLFGENGNDVLTGGDGTNYFIGGLGDDMLIGGSGNDIYYYNPGDGIDHITDTGGTDWVVFTNISSWQVEIGLGSLKISLPDGGELHLDDFDPENPLEGTIEYFQFSDKVMTRQQLIQTLGFKIKGTQGDDDLTGTALGDSIQAFAGNDNLSGGSGNDTLQGGEGNDVYLFGAGDGQDVAIDGLGINTVLLTGGLTESQISLSKAGSDLVVSIPGTADRLTVKDWFSANGADWSLALGDGTVFDRAAVEERLSKNGAPVLVSDTAIVSEDNVIEIFGNTLANDADPEGRALRVTNAGTYTGNYGTLILDNSGEFTYTLNNASAAVQGLAAGKMVSDNFTYTATDDDPAGAASATSSLVITIQGTNDTPTVAFDFNTATEDDAATVTGNVLANDHDADSGTVLQVTQPGSFQGTYGELTIDINGSYIYKINNNLASVQSLGRYQTGTDAFSYTATDGIENTTSSLSINVGGKNDAPTIAAPLVDQSVSANTAYQWQMPTASFTDIDNGDKLFYSASLADGSALPAWLQFDALSGTFSGRVPRDALGYVDIQVNATDKAVNASGLLVPSPDGSSTHDTFRLTFQTSKGGGGGGSGGNGGNGGVGTQGNEGVGNGVDGPPPGHDTSFNDGPGTSPGRPAAQDINRLVKTRPQTQEASIAQITGETYKNTPTLNSGMSKNSSENKIQDNQTEASTNTNINTTSSSKTNAVASLPASETSATASQKDNPVISNNALPTESAKTGADVIQLPVFANPGLLDSGKGTPAGPKESSASVSYISRWKALDSELANHLDTSDTGAAISGAGPINGGQNIFAGSTAPALKNQLSLNGGSGIGLTTFQGLKEGFKKVG